MWQELDTISSFQYNYFFMKINGQGDKVTRNSEGFPNFTLKIHAKVTPATVDNQVWLCFNNKGFPDSSTGKESAKMQETLVQFLGQDDPLEKG